MMAGHSVDYRKAIKGMMEDGVKNGKAIFAYRYAGYLDSIEKVQIVGAKVRSNRLFVQALGSGKWIEMNPNFGDYVAER